MIPLAINLVIPAGSAVFSGTTQLNPGMVGIPRMVEIGVGTIVASIMSDEAFGRRELIGVLMIVSVALIDPCVI